MTAQAKNRILAYIVLAMLAFTVFTSQPASDAPKSSATILIPTDKPVLVVVEEPEFDQDEFECLRTNLYHEAGNQSRRGMEAVALVTLNRTKTKHYPKTVCGVVKSYAVTRRGKVCQFSWYCDGKTDAPNLNNSLEREAWDNATTVATAAMRGKLKDFLGRATHYHANYVSPDWSWPVHSKRYRRLTSVGTHIFYRDVALKLKA